MKKYILLLIFFFLSFSSFTYDKIRAEILLSIDSERKSLYINRIYDETKLISDQRNVSQGLLIARACIRTEFGKKVAQSEYSELEKFADELTGIGSLVQTSREKQIINKYKLYLLFKIA